MRIMEVISGTAVNGAAVNCFEVLRALRARGHELTVVCRPNAWIAGQLAESNIDVEVIESSLRRWPPDELRRIAQLARDRRIQVVHTHMSSASFFGVLLRRLYGVPACVATAHNRYIQLHWLFNDRVIAVSAKMRDDIHSGSYANAVMIGHGPHEFSFDFITNFYPQSAVSARGSR